MVFFLVNAAEKASPSMLVEPPPRPPPIPPSVKVTHKPITDDGLGQSCTDNPDIQSQMLRNPSRPYHMNFKRFMPNFLKPTIVNVIEESFPATRAHYNPSVRSY